MLATTPMYWVGLIMMTPPSSAEESLALASIRDAEGFKDAAAWSTESLAHHYRWCIMKTAPARGFHGTFLTRTAHGPVRARAGDWIYTTSLYTAWNAINNTKLNYTDRVFVCAKDQIFTTIYGFLVLWRSESARRVHQNKIYLDGYSHLIFSIGYI